MDKKRNLPRKCPSCGERLHVRALGCDECRTHIEGDYPLPSLLLLDEADRRFVLDFVLASGSLKEMASLLGLSYPTVRNRLDEIIARLRALENRS